MEQPMECMMQDVYIPTAVDTEAFQYRGIRRRGKTAIYSTRGNDEMSKRFKQETGSMYRYRVKLEAVAHVAHFFGRLHNSRVSCPSL